jgi:hypothetical protein
MEIRLIPEWKKDKVYGVQILLEGCAIDLYLCFRSFKIGILKNKEFDDWSIFLGFFRIESTNLNTEV